MLSRCKTILETRLQIWQNFTYLLACTDQSQFLKFFNPYLLSITKNGCRQSKEPSKNLKICSFSSLGLFMQAKNSPPPTSGATVPLNMVKKVSFRPDCIFTIYFDYAIFLPTTKFVQMSVAPCAVLSCTYVK